MFGIDCNTGDTFTDGSIECSLSNIHVPDPVISLSIAPKVKDHPGYGKALDKFQREDPTFRVKYDAENKETIISGMGELHLEIYVERMKREYGCEVITGKPRVAFKETVQLRAPFDYTHKKQSGGAGQYGRVIGYVEPIIANYEEVGSTDATGEVEPVNIFAKEFVNDVLSGTVPTNFIPACEKGFLEACSTGILTGNPVVNVRFVLQDGASHVVDSNEHSFRTASWNGFRQAFMQARPIILEPIMKLQVSAPVEFQGVVMAGINKRKGVISDTDIREDYVSITADVPLNDMFGYSTDLRSMTQGKGEFTMEYKKHMPVFPNVQEQLISDYQKKRAEELAAKK
jgi:elongation factor G